jgi:hypothetical protein
MATPFSGSWLLSSSSPLDFMAVCVENPETFFHTQRYWKPLTITKLKNHSIKIKRRTQKQVNKRALSIKTFVFSKSAFFWVHIGRVQINATLGCPWVSKNQPPICLTMIVTATAQLQVQLTDLETKSASRCSSLKSLHHSISSNLYWGSPGGDPVGCTKCLYAPVLLQNAMRMHDKSYPGN